MKQIGIIIVALVLTGCVSTRPEQHFAQELGHTMFWADFHFPDGDIRSALASLEQQMNKDKPLERHVHLFVPPAWAPQNTPAVATDDSISAGKRPALDAAQSMSVLTAVEILSQVSGLGFELAPRSRTIVFYVKEDQQPGRPPGKMSSRAAEGGEGSPE